MGLSKSLFTAVLAFQAFVIKTTLPKKGTGSFTVKTQVKVEKLFINVCWHEVIERPVNHLGKPIDDDERQTGGMSISMVVGKTRPCLDHTGAEALACDVVVHPWVRSRAEVDKSFKTELMALVVEWVEKDTNLKCISPTILKNHIYKGGIGKGGKQILPFPLEPEKEEVEGVQIQGAGEVTRENVAKPTRQGQGGGSDALSGQVMDPNSMIKQMMGGDGGVDACGAGSLFDMKIHKEPDKPNCNGSTRKEKNKPLIEEIDPNPPLSFSQGIMTSRQTHGCLFNHVLPPNSIPPAPVHSSPYLHT